MISSDELEFVNRVKAHDINVHPVVPIQELAEEFKYSDVIYMFYLIEDANYGK